ncbi:MAG: 6-phosphofructokinase [Ruminococcaceae bacterium]|nr:6-phosphofructokinase [Oscillospiraceae bacterium]
MEKKFRKIAVLTSGGDAPGMNPAVRAVTRKALEEGVEVIGVLGGYKGLIENTLVPLSPRSVSNIITNGGTMLYSERCPEFKTEEGMAAAIETCRKNNIDAIVAIGGDGTFRGATDLTRRGIPTIGIPATIDNDITATDYTLGYDTAMNTVISLVDDLRDTCESHARCNVVEVMGRDCGCIALNAGIASGAVAIAIPELPFDEEAMFEKIKSVKAAGKRGMIVMISEGIPAIKGGDYCEKLTARLNELLESRFSRLAHIVRGGSPSLRDRLTATEMGVLAVELLLKGESNVVICEIDGKLQPVEINFALILDRMYKNKLKDGDLDMFSAEQIDEMRAVCAKRKAEIERLYQIARDVCK